MKLSPDGYAAIFTGVGVVVAIVVHLVRSGKQWGKIDATVKNIDEKTLPGLNSWVSDLAAEQKETTRTVHKLGEAVAGQKATDEALTGRVDRLERITNGG